MIYDTPSFLKNIPPKRLLGIDYGMKRIGIALSDTRQSIASSHETLIFKSNAQVLKAVGDMIQAFDIGGLVIGMPRNMNGTYGPMAEAAEAFAKKLIPLGLPILLWDERLSSAAAHRTLSGVMTTARKKEVIDQLAATLILQNFLDYMKHQR